MKKNKKSIKNLKQYRVRSKFLWYVVARPVLQKWFFVPVAVFILSCGVYDWYDNRGRWEFTNEPVTGVEEIRTVSDESTSPEEGNLLVGNPTPVQVIQKVAEKEGIDWKILYALFQKETQGNCNREGDHQFIKTSIGCYQINRYFHPEVTWEQATDLEWSSHWTAKRLKRNADKYGMANAIMRHNGSPTNPAVQAYYQDVKQIIETL